MKPKSVISSCFSPLRIAKAFEQKSRPPSLLCRRSAMNSYFLAYSRTISSVPSVEASLTITHFLGNIVWLTTDLSTCSINAASFRAGVISTYLSLIICSQPFSEGPQIANLAQSSHPPHIQLSHLVTEHLASAFARAQDLSAATKLLYKVPLRALCWRSSHRPDQSCLTRSVPYIQPMTCLLRPTQC